MIATERTPQQERAALRRHLVGRLIAELALPLGGYYALCAAHRAVPCLPRDKTAPYRHAGTASLVTGDPRTLLVRDSWILGALGLWVLATLFTQHPFIRNTSRTIVTVKVGEEGYRQWDARWDNHCRFRSWLRVLTAVWGMGFTLDALVRVLLAHTIPIDSVPLVSTVQWLVVLGGLVTFHIAYITKHGLKS